MWEDDTVNYRRRIWKKIEAWPPRSFWHKIGHHTQWHMHTHTCTHVHKDTYVPQIISHGLLVTLWCPPWLTPEISYSGKLTMAPLAMVTDIAVFGPTGKGTTVSRPPYGSDVIIRFSFPVCVVKRIVMSHTTHKGMSYLSFPKLCYISHIYSCKR